MLKVFSRERRSYVRLSYSFKATLLNIVVSASFFLEPGLNNLAFAQTHLTKGLKPMEISPAVGTPAESRVRKNPFSAISVTPAPVKPGPIVLKKNDTLFTAASKAPSALDIPIPLPPLNPASTLGSKAPVPTESPLLTDLGLEPEKEKSLPSIKYDSECMKVSVGTDTLVFLKGVLAKSLDVKPFKCISSLGVEDDWVEVHRNKYAGVLEVTVTPLDTDEEERYSFFNVTTRGGQSIQINVLQKN